MKVENILKEAIKRELTLEESIFLLNEINDPISILKLMETARIVTNNVKKDKLLLFSKISPNFKCINNPICSYCGSSCIEKEKMTLDEFRKVLSWLKEKKIRNIEFGETTYSETGEEVFPYLEEISKSGIIDKLWINIGKNLNEEAIKRFSEYGVTGIGSSFEVIGESAFLKYRKGDNFENRLEHLKIAEKLKMDFYNYLFVGSGESNSEKMEYFSQIKKYNGKMNLILIPWSEKNDLFNTIKTGSICRLFSNDWNIDVCGKEFTELNILSGGNMSAIGGAWIKKEREINKDLEDTYIGERGFINIYSNLNKVKYLKNYSLNGVL